MGKADKGAAKNATANAYSTGAGAAQAGINETQNRIGTTLPRSDAERAEIWKNYQGFGSKSASDYLGGLSGNLGGPASSSGGGGGVGGGGVSVTPSDPDYVGVWQDLMDKNGGFDPDRLNRINQASTSLMDFAKTGGITDDMRNNVNRDYLLNMEKTGGYNPEDIANIRERSNRAIPAAYANMQDSMNRRRGVNNFGPGFDRVGFKMARQGAQDMGTQARDTELGISDAIRSGRADASKFLSGQNLALDQLGSNNTLEGYKGAAGIDTGLQSTINQSRLGASTAKAQNERALQSIAASSGAASAALNAANARWAQQMEQQDRMFGASGMLDTYKAAPTELMYDQDLLRNYRNDLASQGWDEVKAREGIGSMPGWTDAFKNVAGGLAGLWGAGSAAIRGGHA